MVEPDLAVPANPPWPQVAWGKPVARPLVAMYPATVQTAAGFSAVNGWSVTPMGAMVRAPQVSIALPFESL